MLLKSFKILSLIEKDAYNCAKTLRITFLVNFTLVSMCVYSMVLVLVFKFTEPGIK